MNLPIAILLVLITLCPSSGAETLDGNVLHVVDGDTLTLSEGDDVYSIRLSEIDTPEMDQPWGMESKAALTAKVYGAAVRVVVVDTDRYGRKIAKIWVGERDINRELVREGHAWVYERYLIDKTLLDDQVTVQSAGVGLWRDTKAIPPWQWRTRATE